MPLKLKRYPNKSNQWYLRGTVRGQEIFETTGTDDAKVAEAIRIKREAQLLERSIFGPEATITFAEAALSYLEQGGEAKYLGHFNKATGKWTLLLGIFANTPLVKIGQQEIDQAARTLFPNGSPSTRKRQVNVPMCAVLNHAARRKWVAPQKIEHPKVKPPVTKFSSAERMEKLLPHCKPPLRRLLMVMAYTGLRLGEAMKLDWDLSVNLERRTLIIDKTKNGDGRAAYIPEPLLVELTSVPEEQRHGRMFPWSDKCHVYGPLRTACARAGVEYLAPHQQGRHTFATWLIDYSGVSLRGLMEAGGWKSVQSVIRYVHTSPGQAAKAANLLPAVNNPWIKNDPASKSLKSKKK